MGKALIVVDVQNDFCEEGSLAIEGGNQVAEKIGAHLEAVSSFYDIVLTTQDWHNPPPDSNDSHFALDGEPNFKTSWPVHCVADSTGADLHEAIYDGLGAWVQNNGDAQWFHKGQGCAAYSGFEANNPRGYLGDVLEDVIGPYGSIRVVGLAYDYCVAATALDAKKFFPGADVAVMLGLTASVARDSEIRATQKLTLAGVHVG